jgi:multiple sugar transport system substrate-binding protein
MKRVEQKYNVKIKSIVHPWGEIAEMLMTSSMAGEPFADVVFSETKPMMEMVSNGFILPTDDYMPANCDALNMQMVCKAGIELFGRRWYFTTVPYVDASATMLGVNLDIINSIGAENPVDLYEAGNWTFDTFLDICKKATRDTDNDGAIDQWGFSGPHTWVLMPIVASNDGQLFDHVTGKQALDNPKTLRALEFLRTMYLDEKIAYIPETQWYDFVYLMSSFANGNVAFFQTYIWQIGQAGQLNYDYTVVPWPKGPDNTTGQSYFALPSGGMITKGTKDPQMVYQIYEELCDWWGNDVDLAKDVSSVTWVMDNFLREEDALRALSIPEKGAAYDLVDAIEGFDPGSIFGPIITGDQTVAQTVESVKDQFQAAADELFAKMITP